jgi:hypothetical protein
MKIKLDAGAGEGGGGGGGTPTPADWRPLVPETMRSEKMLESIKDVPSLVKGYMEAQRMVGADKIVKPNEKWTDTDWGQFFNTVGRPPTPDKYTFKPEADETYKSLNLDAAKVTATKAALHSAGLTDKQAASVMKYYLDTVAADSQKYQETQAKNQAETLAALNKEYGDATKVKIDIAKSVVQKFGGQQMVDMLEQTGLGNNVQFIKMFAQIGEAMLDDKALGGGNNLILTIDSAAKKEIDNLKGDKEFINQLSDRQNPGHKAALKKWEDLHKIAYPGQEGGTQQK